MGGLLKAAMGIHKERRMPRFPREDFSAWADRQGLREKDRGNEGGRIAFFAGCTGNYLFPEVPRAVVDVLKHNGLEIYFPEQKCCGMPPMLEGDRKVTLDFVGFNVESLAEAVEDGYDIVCSCPTCSYMLRTVLGEGAYFSSQFQESVGSDEREIKVPVERIARHGKAVELTTFSRTIYKGIFKDDGYFSPIDPLKRIKVAENTYDLGEYLSLLHKAGRLSTEFAPVGGRMSYYPPCHLREQKIGRPYVEFLKMIPGGSIEVIDGAFYCCGLAGVMGFKREYHETSIQLGRPLMEKISSLNPDRIVTECLSCRLQFNQLLPYDVVHPVELLRQAYGGIGSETKAV